MIDLRVLLKCKNNQEFLKKFDSLLHYKNGTWKNKKRIQDPKKLRDFEYHTSYQRSQQLIKKGIPIKSLAQLQQIHHYLFNPAYEWAGQFRTYDISKNGSDFMPHCNFSNAFDFINHELDEYNKLTKLTDRQYAHLLNDINYLHPFPEGNGRSTKTFLQILAHNHGQQLNYDRHQNKIIQAMDDVNITQLASCLHVTKLGQSPIEAKKQKEADLEF